MKRFLMLILFALTAFVLADENLLKNGDFSDGAIAPWISAQRSGGRKDIHTVGDGKLKIVGDPENKYNGNLNLVQTLPELKQGTRYLLRFRVRSYIADATGKKLSVNFRQVNAAGGSINYVGVNADLTAKEWRNYLYVLTPHKDSVKHQLYVTTSNLTASDVVEIDDISVMIAPPLQRDGNNLVLNGDFEYFDLTPWTSVHSTPARPLQHLSGDTVYGKQCLICRGDETSKYKDFITLIQPLPELKQGVNYQLSARVRAGSEELREGRKSIGNKSFKIAVREANEKGASLRYDEITVNLADDSWQYYELIFTPNKQAAKYQLYIIASNLSYEDEVAVDNIRLVVEGDVGEAFNPLAKASAASVKTLAKDGFDAKINATTGMLHSLSADGKLLQPAAKNAAMITIESEGKECQLDGKGTPFNGFSAKAEYSIVNGMFREVVTVEALQDFNDPVKIGVRHGFLSADWKKILGALRPVRAIPSDKATIFSYLGDPNDLNPGILETYQHTAFPLVILENDDFYLMLGSSDFDQFVTLSPNHPMGYVPALQRNPIKTKKGDKFRFETNWRLFDRKKYMLRDVWRFYQEQLVTKNALLTPYFPAKFTEERHFYPGAFGSHTYFLKEREDRLPPNPNVWFYSVHDSVHEQYHTSGEWWSAGNSYKEKIEANKLKAYIARLQNERGFKLIMYLRGLANLKDREQGVLPDDWFYRTPGGALHLYGGGYQVKLPEHVAKDVGYDAIPWGNYNFGNPDFRKFYMKQIFDAMDFYQPKAIGWDMGALHEEFSVLAETYTRLRNNGHKIYVVANEGAGPVQPYTDMVMIENGQLGGKSAYDFEVNRAYTTALICLERFGIFQLAFDANTKGIKTWLSEKGLAENKRYLFDLLERRPELKENKIEAARLCQLRASIYDLALGASPGYMEEAAPVPPILTRFAGDANGLFMVNKSFAVMFPNRSNVDGYKAVSAWRDDSHFRLVAVNDDKTPADMTVLFNKAYFASKKWNFADFKAFKATNVNAEGETPTTATLADGAEHFKLTFKLPPFTALFFEADK